MIVGLAVFEEGNFLVNMVWKMRKDLMRMFIDAVTPPPIEMVIQEEQICTFDRKIGDVTGDGIDDFVYLTGHKKNPDAIYQEGITISVVDGVTNEVTEQVLDLNGGYGSALFLGDFNQDEISDIYVSISSGGSGNINYYYIYSFKDKTPVQLLDYQSLNQLYEWSVRFLDHYQVEVINDTLNQTYELNLSFKNKEFLQKYYDSEGKTREGVEGEVLPLGGLSPIMTPRGKGAYSLLSSQVIIGTAMVDHLGVIEIYLTYQEGKFIPYDMVIGEQGNIK